MAIFLAAILMEVAGDLIDVVEVVVFSKIIHVLLFNECISGVLDGAVD